MDKSDNNCSYEITIKKKDKSNESDDTKSEKSNKGPEKVDENRVSLSDLQI